MLRQLQTTNVHLNVCDFTRRYDEQSWFLFPIFIFLLIIFSCTIDADLQKKLDTNRIQCTQLLLHNKELKTKCHLLQHKIDRLEQNNIHLIQRLTQQVKITLFSCTSKDNIFCFPIFKGSSFNEQVFTMDCKG